MSTIRRDNRQEQELRAIIDDIPGNDRCADCEATAPRWASYSLGVFLCTRCASIHRKNSDISKVKSISLDNWQPDQVQYMREVGNTISNYKFNPLREWPIQDDDQTMERFIKDKYERKKFMSQHETGNFTPSRSAMKGSHAPISPAQSSSAAIKYSKELDTLREMGFTDRTRNVDVLKSVMGDVASATDVLVAMESTDGKAPPKKPERPRVRFTDDTIGGLETPAMQKSNPFDFFGQGGPSQPMGHDPFSSMPPSMFHQAQTSAPFMGYQQDGTQQQYMQPAAPLRQQLTGGQPLRPQLQVQQEQQQFQQQPLQYQLTGKDPVQAYQAFPPQAPMQAIQGRPLTSQQTGPQQNYRPQPLTSQQTGPQPPQMQQAFQGNLFSNEPQMPSSQPSYNPSQSRPLTSQQTGPQPPQFQQPFQANFFAPDPPNRPTSAQPPFNTGYQGRPLTSQQTGPQQQQSFQANLFPEAHNQQNTAQSPFNAGYQGRPLTSQQTGPQPPAQQSFQANLYAPEPPNRPNSAQPPYNPGYQGRPLTSQQTGPQQFQANNYPSEPPRPNSAQPPFNTSLRPAFKPTVDLNAPIGSSNFLSQQSTGYNNQFMPFQPQRTGVSPQHSGMPPQSDPFGSGFSTPLRQELNNIQPSKPQGYVNPFETSQMNGSLPSGQFAHNEPQYQNGQSQGYPPQTQGYPPQNTNQGYNTQGYSAPNNYTSGVGGVPLSKPFDKSSILSLYGQHR